MDGSVESDFAAITSMLDTSNPSTYCQAIAKCQQVAEKSINAIDAALRERGVIVGRAQAQHYPEKMLNRLARLSPGEQDELTAKVTNLLRRRFADIHDLCQLAPRLPPRGELLRKNTEYPFNLQDGNWTAPAAEGTFSLKEVDRFHNLAKVLRNESQRIITAAGLHS